MKVLMKLIYLLCLTVSFIPTNSKADINYAFIKVVCDHGSKTAMVSTFYDWNESGEERAKHPEKDTYYLDDVSKNNTAIECNLGDKSKVTVKGVVFTEHQSENTLVIYLNGSKIKSISINLLPSDVVTIKSLAEDNAAFVTECIDDRECKENTGFKYTFSCKDAKHVDGQACLNTKIKIPNSSN